MSDMSGIKAGYLSDFCKNQNRAFLRFDYSGHGISEGKFEDGTLSQWIKDTIDVIDAFNISSCVLVGSSMGGWIMLHTAINIKDRVKGLLGIAAAPDFTRDLFEKELNNDERKELMEKRVVRRRSSDGDLDYVITKKLIDDGEINCLLDNAIEITVPVRLIQGMEDQQVPWATSILLSKKIQTTDVEIQLIKDGDHRFSNSNQLSIISITLRNLLCQVEQS
tara:strand:+ start:172 stop:834 length:663 start_codon:yes stop_codon:yes gene_type:complete